MQINRIIFLIGLILIQGCAPTSNDISKNSNLLKPVDKPKDNPLVIGFNQDFDFKRVKPGHIKEGTDYVIAEAEKIKIEIISKEDSKRTYENTLVRIDDIYNVIESVWSPGYLMGSVHTNEEIRNEGLESSKTIQNYMTELSLD